MQEWTPEAEKKERNKIDSRTTPILIYWRALTFPSNVHFSYHPPKFELNKNIPKGNYIIKNMTYTQFEFF